MKKSNPLYEIRKTPLITKKSFGRTVMKKRQQAERHGRRRQQCDRAGFPLPDITSSSVYNATLEFIFFEVHAALNRVACRYASNRASPRRPKLLLPALRSPLFCDAFAALREGEQYRKMCSLRTNHGQVGFNQLSYLQAHSST